MYTNIYRLLLCFVFLICFYDSSLSQSWPILANDDINGYYRVSCAFGEIHPTNGDHFHEGIDIDCNDDIIVRPIEDGVIIDADSPNKLVIGHGTPVGGQYPRITKIHEFQRSQALVNGQSVTAGITNLGMVVSTWGHLHQEMWVYDGSIEHPINPLNNNESWTLELPAGHEDTYGPEINDVYIEPLTNVGNGSGSGF
ncbi:MAG: hypothetical protein PHU97_10700 [Bacteroidales bacterium]|jgi:hypothetical protein|nr:hypothetical protein [Bacteroidales bacterium]